jgi:hypothetical protein
MTSVDLGANVRIYSRDEWDARSPRSMATNTELREAFLHHSDHARAEVLDHMEEQIAVMKGMQNYHMDVKGWSDIGYHFVVFQVYGNLPVVRIFRARETKFVPAAQEGHNTGTVAICTVGNFQNDDAIKADTITAIALLLRYIDDNHGGSLKTVGGHRDVVGTSCPGNTLYAKIPEIAQRAKLVRY